MSPTQLRTFDVRHDGTLLGEGAAFVVLEASDCVAAPLAVLRGNGSSSDAKGMTAPDTSGAALRMAMERSLADAGLAPADIGVLNAHGSGTPLNDLTERAAFAAVFAGTSGPVVFGTKGNFGHSLGATGAIEAVATILALRHRKAPPVFGLEQPDPEFALPLPVGEALDIRSGFGMNVTLGFGGFDTSLVFEAGI